MNANGEACDELQFHDVVKKPVKKIIIGKEETKEMVQIKEWKSQLEAMYLEKEKKQEMIGQQQKKFSSSLKPGQPSGVAGSSTSLNTTMPQQNSILASKAKASATNLESTLQPKKMTLDPGSQGTA